MKNQKIIGITICMLLILTAISATGITYKYEPANYEFDPNNILDMDLESPPAPGYCPEPFDEIFLPNIAMNGSIASFASQSQKVDSFDVVHALGYMCATVTA